MGLYSSKPYRIDNNALPMALPKNKLKSLLEPLFAEIQRINIGAGATPQNSAFASTGNEPQFNQTAMNNQNTFANFTEQQNKNKSTMAIIGFVLSILTLLGSCFGVAAGLLLYFAEYYLATQGLKSDKKGLAIATYVLATLGLIITILSILLQNF